MNCLEEKQLLSEMACGTNFAYILQDNTLFLPTEYKVLQSQPEGIYVRCMKMLYNGKIQLYYSTAGLQSLQTMIQILLHFVLDQSHLPAFAVKSARFTHTVMSFKHFCFMIMNVNGETGSAHSAHAIRKQVFVSSLSTTLDMNLIKSIFR